MSKLPTELLTSFSSSVRSGLPRVVEQLHARLGSLEGSERFGGKPTEVFPVAASYNLCSLIEVWFGRPQRASQLCSSAIEWLGRQATRHDSPGLMGYAFQPCINLIRLARYQRNWDECTARLRFLRRPCQHGEESLGGVPMTQANWHAMRDLVSQLDDYLLFNWLQQELLCAIQSEDQRRVWEAEASCGSQHQALCRGMLYEAKAILGMPIEVAALAREDSRIADVVAIRRAERAARAGPLAADDPQVTELDEIAAELLAGEALEVWQVTAVQAVVKLIEPVRPESAAGHSAAAFHASQRLGDEVLGYWFAEACLRLDHPDPSFADRVEDFRNRSWHAQVRRDDHPEHPDRSRMIDQLTDRLQALAANLDCRPAAPAQPDVQSAHKETGSPLLLGQVMPDLLDPDRASARFLFASRQLEALGPALAGDVPAEVQASAKALDFSGQDNFAARPFAEAMASSGPVARYLLIRIAGAFAARLGMAFDEQRLSVTVRVDQRGRYRQLQGAHIDWAKTAEFHEASWRTDCAEVNSTGRSFRKLGGCSSIDCVLGGPATEFFLDECEGMLHLVRQNSRAWRIEGISFKDLGKPTPGRVGELTYRPPYTVHQFPAPASWTTGNEQRLFVSCDFHAL